MHVTRDHPPRHPLHAHSPPRHLFHARNPQPPAASPILRAEPVTTCRVTRFVHRTRDHPPRHPFCTQNPAPPTTSPVSSTDPATPRTPPVSRTEPGITRHITRFMHGTRHDPPHHPFHAQNLRRPAPFAPPLVEGCGWIKCTITTPIASPFHKQHQCTGVWASMATAFHIRNPLPLPIPCYFVSAHAMPPHTAHPLLTPIHFPYNTVSG